MGNFFNPNKVSGITNFTTGSFKVKVQSASEPISGFPGGHPQATGYGGYMYFIGEGGSIYRYPVQYPVTVQLIIAGDGSGEPEAPFQAGDIGTFSSLAAVQPYNSQNGLYLLSIREGSGGQEVYISRLSFSDPTRSQLAGAIPDDFSSVAGPTIPEGQIGNLVCGHTILYFQAIAGKPGMQHVYQGEIAAIFGGGEFRLSTFPVNWPGTLTWTTFWTGQGVCSLVKGQDSGGDALYTVFVNPTDQGLPSAPTLQAVLSGYGSIGQMVQVGAHLYFLSVDPGTQPDPAKSGIFLYGFDEADPDADCSIQIGPLWINQLVRADGFSISGSNASLLLSSEIDPPITYRMNPTVDRTFTVPAATADGPGLISFDAMVAVPFGLTNAGGFLTLSFLDLQDHPLTESYLFHTTDPVDEAVGYWTATTSGGPFSLLAIRENPMGGNNIARGLLMGIRDDGGGILIIGEMDIDPFR